MFRSLLILCLAGMLCSCQTPLPEINYRGTFSADIEDVFSAGDRFVESFAKESGFHVKSRAPWSGVGNRGSRVDVQLRSKSTKRVWIYVTITEDNKRIYVTIGGDFSSQIAIDAARISERVFAELFPDSKYVPFQRYQGLFGP